MPAIFSLLTSSTYQLTRSISIHILSRSRCIDGVYTLVDHGGYDILHSAALLCGSQFLLPRAISVCRRIFILLVIVQLYQTVLNE
jgi:hypothetical protein